MIGLETKMSQRSTFQPPRFCRTGRSLPTLTFRATRRIRRAIPADTATEQSSKIPEPPDPEEWRACRNYLYGIDLFNHGFYWEAHEAWEGLWVACGRRGPTATYLQALNLAAAGFKARV